jgi:ABC-type uncharacterized transport system ATPase subunit
MSQYVMGPVLFRGCVPAATLACDACIGQRRTTIGGERQAARMIDVDSLRFRYPGTSSDTLKGLSFSVAEGEIFGFLGPSGAGKSTTQKILTGVARGYDGVARVL